MLIRTLIIVAPAFLTFAFSLATSAADPQTPKFTFQHSDSEVQYFSGLVQTSSLDGSIPYGPSYESTVRRIVNRNEGQIIECVVQNDEIFLTTMTRTLDPLIYTVEDAQKSFTGTLHFTNASLLSWSYNIQVLQPNQGLISGQLPDRGATIDLEKKTMQIKKVWNDQVLISETYHFIEESSYLQKVEALKLKNSKLSIPKNCQ